MALRFFLLLAALWTTPAVAQAPPTEHLAPVLAPLEAYLDAHATGEAAPLRRAFFPEALIQFVRDDTLRTWTLEEYASRFTGTPAPDEAERRRRIASVDVEGDAAVARLELDYPQARFVDYMTLLRRGGEWRIVHKAFHVEPRARP